MRKLVRNFIATTLLVVTLAACGDQTKVRRTLRSVGAHHLRTQTIAACGDAFSAKAPQEVPCERWPESVRAFEPMGLWAEPDGAYLLIDSDGDGERGIYLPRIVSDKDPLCSPALKHEKLAAGVYWYERKRH